MRADDLWDAIRGDPYHAYAIEGSYGPPVVRGLAWSERGGSWVLTRLVVEFPAGTHPAITVRTAWDPTPDQRFLLQEWALHLDTARGGHDTRQADAVEPAIAAIVGRIEARPRSSGQLRIDGTLTHVELFRDGSDWMVVALLRSHAVSISGSDDAMSSTLALSTELDIRPWLDRSLLSLPRARPDA